MRKKLTLQKKVTIVVSLFVVLFVCIVVITAKEITSYYIGNYFQSDVDEKSKIVLNMIEEMKQKSFHSTAWFERSERLVNAVTDENRESAIKLGMLAMESMGFDYFVITDADGIVFARAHAPEKFGDSILDQKNIQEALKGNTSAGIEQGTVVKYSIRAGTPLRDKKNTIIGAISMGYNLSNNELVDRLKKIVDCEITLFDGNTRINTTLMTDGKRIDGTKMEHKEIIDTVIGQGKPFYNKATILGDTYHTAYQPLRDVSGKVTGMIFVGKKVKMYDQLIFTLVTSQAVIVSVVGLLFLLILLFNARVLIIDKIKLLSAQMHDIAHGGGDLTVKLKVTSNDEIGDLIRDFNSFTERMREVIKSIGDLTVNLSASAEEMASTTDTFTSSAQDQAYSEREVNSTTEELHAGMIQIAEYTDIQSKNMNELVVMMKDLSETSAKTMNVVNQAMLTTESMTTNATAGGTSLDEMTRSMKKISESSSKMNDIVNIINDISDKINLLSLNAAIESARAGDAGRGFAVVADEISKLADQTASSIKEIVDLIKINEVEIEIGNSSVKVTNEKIGMIIKEMKSVNDMMKKVFEDISRQLNSNKKMGLMVETVKEKTTDIQSASSIQKLATDEIVSLSGKLSEKTTAMAAGSEQMDSTAKQISSMAETLSERISFFKY